MSDQEKKPFRQTIAVPVPKDIKGRVPPYAGQNVSEAELEAAVTGLFYALQAKTRFPTFRVLGRPRPLLTAGALGIFGAYLGGGALMYKGARELSQMSDSQLGDAFNTSVTAIETSRAEGGLVSGLANSDSDGDAAAAAGDHRRRGDESFTDLGAREEHVMFDARPLVDRMLRPELHLGAQRRLAALSEDERRNVFRALAVLKG